VVNSKNLILGPIWTERSLKISRAWEIFTEGLLDLYFDAISSGFCTMTLDD